MRISDWSSDVCSSDLAEGRVNRRRDRVVRLSLKRWPGPSCDPPAAPARQKRKRVHDMKLNDIRDNEGARHRKIRSEEHTSELQSLMRISYAVFCLKKKKNTRNSST